MEDKDKNEIIGYKMLRFSLIGLGLILVLKMVSEILDWGWD